MGLVRENPVPPGTYWIALEVGNPEALEVAQWLVRPNTMGHNFHSRETQRRGGFDVMVLENRAPSEWPENFFLSGFLLNEGNEGMSAEDTAQRPDPEPDAVDQIGDTIEAGHRGARAAANVLTFGLPLLGAAALVWMAYQMGKGKR